MLTRTVDWRASHVASAGFSSVIGRYGRRMGPQQVKFEGIEHGKSVSGRDGSRQGILRSWVFSNDGVGPGIPLALRNCSRLLQTGADRSAKMRRMRR